MAIRSAVGRLFNRSILTAICQIAVEGPTTRISGCKERSTLEILLWTGGMRQERASIFLQSEVWSGALSLPFGFADQIE